MSEARRWQDLLPRVLSGLAMAALGAGLLWLGGWPFAVMVCAVCGVMIWEAARMFSSAAPVQDGVLAGGALALAWLLSGMFVLPLLLAAGLVCAGRAGRDKPLYLVVTVWIMLASFALIVLRDSAGVVWFFWLAAVIVASDVAGYFVGKALGGPKFWPRVSPRKTWSGTLAGWLGAALVGWAFAGPTGEGLALIAISVLVAMAGQMGDIAESAVKRRMGVKDSSGLIPGHGGVLDRFDALMGSAAMMLILWSFGLIPVAP